jgi:hypothetical protein
MPTAAESGLIEPDIIVNGRALTFAECMAVRVAIGSFRLSLTSPSLREGIGEGLASNYDHHLANVEQTMLKPALVRKPAVAISHGGRSSLDVRGTTGGKATTETKS